VKIYIIGLRKKATFPKNVVCTNIVGVLLEGTTEQKTWRTSV
jgi:hypothetical protein